MCIELKRILTAVGILNVASAERYLLDELKALQRKGELSLGRDEDLSGMSLELRVQQLFQSVGFDIREGRVGMEDFVVEPCEHDKITDKLVLEVKSSRNVQLQLDDLRQLDDWVFDLSGEELARKVGLGGGVDLLALQTGGMMSARKRHPKPHKGVLVFNGPLGVGFASRSSSILHSNLLEFAEKRNFCVIGLGQLIKLLKSDRQTVWETLHKTVGGYLTAT